MNDTPTPRTDEKSFEDDTGYEVVSVGFARQLETELTAVTEQRDRLAEALEQWQPIETAPKDRSFILSAHPEHGYLITRWLGAREMWDGWAIEPTHWMSLPKLTTP